MHRNMHALSLVPSDPFSTLSDVSSALVCVFCGALWRFVKARIKKQESKSKNRKAKTQSNKELTPRVRVLFLFWNNTEAP